MDEDSDSAGDPDPDSLSERCADDESMELLSSKDDDACDAASGLRSEAHSDDVFSMHRRPHESISPSCDHLRLFLAPQKPAASSPEADHSDDEALHTRLLQGSMSSSSDTVGLFQAQAQGGSGPFFDEGDSMQLVAEDDVSRDDLGSSEPISHGASSTLFERC